MPAQIRRHDVCDHPSCTADYTDWASVPSHCRGVITQVKQKQTKPPSPREVCHQAGSGFATLKVFVDGRGVNG